jgi:hypothetical protein
MESALPYPGDNEFRADARFHQSEFRENILRIDFDVSNKRAKYGNLLPRDAAKQGVIFYEGYRDYIMGVARKRYGKINSTALYSNLLRSEHIPLNIFTPMELNLDNAKDLFNEIISGGIANIKEIKIEHPGSYNPTKYLEDRTSFDTFILYTSITGLQGGIGIEVKYTELGYKIGKKESEDIKNLDHPYTSVTKSCGYFIDPDPLKFKADHLRQIWRNHILGASMLQAGDIDIFHCIHLYPKGNSHFHEKALPEYRNLLTQKGKETFWGLTYEDLFSKMKTYFTSAQEVKWIEYLNNRYLF